MANVQDLRSGKTSPERSVPTRARTSGASSKACAVSGTKPFLFLDMRNGQPQATSWQTVSQSPGEKIAAAEPALNAEYLTAFEKARILSKELRDISTVKQNNT